MRRGFAQHLARLDWGNRDAVLGNAAILLAALLWGASIVHNRGHVWRSTPFQLAPWQALLAAAILTSVAYAFEGPPVVQWDLRFVLLLLFAGIPGTALAYWAAAVSSSELPASTTSLGLMATPAVSIVVAMGLLGEQPTVPLIAALALILLGVAVGISGERPAANAAFVRARRRTAALRCRGRQAHHWADGPAAAAQAGSMPLARMIGAAAGAVR